MTVCWFLIFLVLLFIELITINLVSIWFALGAVVAMISSFFIESTLVQIVVFVVASIISLIITKPLIKKFKTVNVEATNLDRVIGKTGFITKKITSSDYGEVKVLGTIWTATSDEEIDVGTKVIVKKIDGVKLIVEKKEEE